MMPPFAGQGLNTGLRDATNLAWKLAGVIRGELGSQMLDSYEQERRPHAEAMIAMSLQRGQAIMTTNLARAYARDTVVALARRIRPLRRRLDDMPLKPPPRFASGLVIELAESDGGIPGRMLPQPRVLLANGRQCLLDEVLGPWFSLLAIEPADHVLESLRSPVWAQLGMRVLRLAPEPVFPPTVPDGHPRAITDADGLLERFLGDHRGRAVVVRPDRFVLGAFRPDQEAEFAAALAAAAATTDSADAAPVATPYSLSQPRSSP
jgi:3-(3-hydroxy-phenyl)propionate hydroxylase